MADPRETRRPIGGRVGTSPAELIMAITRMTKPLQLATPMLRVCLGTKVVPNERGAKLLVEKV